MGDIYYVIIKNSQSCIESGMLAHSPNFICASGCVEGVELALTHGNCVHLNHISL